jgi:1-acyl-sn-glycerol-3-phosphate acyltransferase
VVGAVLRRCGHIRVNRSESSAVDALDSALSAIREGSVVAGYPEGRITLHPGMWPERARSGLARLALVSDAPVIPVSQWGAHEVMAWHGWPAMTLRLFGSFWRRPVVWVRFGAPVDLSGLQAEVPRHAVYAASRITAAVTEGLRPLRRAEPALPRYVDPTRPVSVARGFVGAEGQDGRSARV